MSSLGGFSFTSRVGGRLAALLFASAIVLAVASVGQSETGAPAVTEGSLCYRSAISGRYETVPLIHTDVALDVRGLVAAATVTQQYANNSTAPIEAVYIFPLP